MLSDDDLSEPVTVGGVAHLMAAVLIQIAETLLPDDSDYEEALEDIANGLIEISNDTKPGEAKSLIEATSQALVATEFPARDPST